MTSPSASRPAAVALDLGSTRFKRALLSSDGELGSVQAVAAPSPSGEGLIRQLDPEAVLAAATRLLDEAAPAGTPLGIACQRSSFLLWEAAGGTPVTPVISWQDRRAAAWCEARAGLAPLVTARTGLPLSPHYAGPKLASLIEADAGLARGMARGELLFGTLDTWLVWQLSRPRVHEVDLGMAARTAMVRLDSGGWDSLLLGHFDVPAAALPRIVPSAGRAVPLANGLCVAATLADQAAGALALMDFDRAEALVNFGTGAFVLWPVPDASRRLPGYLTAPLGGPGINRVVVEGTINGAGPALDSCAPGPTHLPARDPCPGAFALPDQAGLGAPHWRAEMGLVLSPAAQELPGPARRRVVLEGLLFRVREILEGLGGGRLPGRIVVSGGLVADPAVAAGLATLTGVPVSIAPQAEATLLGAARVAAGLAGPAWRDGEPVLPGASGAYLPAKYPRWRGWLNELLTE